MTSSPNLELTIVGNRPEPWAEFCSFMKSHGLNLHHKLQKDVGDSRVVLAFQAPVDQSYTDGGELNSFKSMLCEGLFAKKSWPLVAELLKDIANESFETLGELLQNVDQTASVSVRSAKERHDLKEKMVEHLKNRKVRTTITDRCFIVAEEMLMNAIYDAPTDKSGKSLYNHLSRKQDVLLNPEQYSTFEYGCKDEIVAVAVSDPFGGLTRTTLFAYLESCYNGSAGEMNEKLGKGGAGRGLHQIVEHADLTVFQVKKGVRTRVVCYFWQRENPMGPNPQLGFIYFD